MGAVRYNVKVVVMILRGAFLAGGAEQVRTTASRMVRGGLTDEQMLKIAKADATLRGFHPGRVEYVEKVKLDLEGDEKLVELELETDPAN